MKFVHKKYSILIVGLVLGVISLAAWQGNRLADYFQRSAGAPDTDTSADEDGPVPDAVSADPQEIAQLPTDTSALGGFNVMIADRGNNRLLEVTPDKKIIWEYQFHLPRPGLGADDVFFTRDGKSVIVNLEEYHVIQLIDYQSEKVTWSYGHPGQPGDKPGFLNTPDDAYQLPNGDIIVADIKNCRIIEINPDKQIVRQYGVTKKCSDAPGHLNKPNGDTPLPGGHVFISDIAGHSVIELDEQWKPVFDLTLPLTYPSDPQLTRDGNILVSEYTNPGRIVEFSRQGKITWEYDSEGTTRLNRPSLAIELPNGNILANDDFNHRIIVIDKKTKHIVWQYGVTGKPGVNAGQLNIPDGFDIIAPSAASSTPASVQPEEVPTIGQLTRHPDIYLGKVVSVAGYVLQVTKDYAIFSDESTGAISRNDLPVAGQGILNLTLHKKYLFQGMFESGSHSSNLNPNFLLLDMSPQPD